MPARRPRPETAGPSTLFWLDSSETIIALGRGILFGGDGFVSLIFGLGVPRRGPEAVVVRRIGVSARDGALSQAKGSLASFRFSLLRPWMSSRWAL